MFIEASSQNLEFAMPAVGGRSQDKIGWLKPSRSGTCRGFIREVEGTEMKHGPVLIVFGGNLFEPRSI